jgi:cytochrome c peroxidase
MGGGEEVVFAAAKQSRHPGHRSHGPSLVTFVGLVLAATGLATLALVLLTSTTLAQSAPHFEPDIPKQLASLKTVTAPTPPNLSDFVLDKPSAIALGKALFWDQQMGGDGQTACATCHFQAGADVRTKNTISPGVMAGTTNFFGKGPNYQLTLNDYPLHHLIDGDDNQSVVLGDTEDVTGSQGVFYRTFGLPGIPGALTKGVDSCTPTADPTFIVGGVNTRRVTGRNAPSVIDAAYNFRNFWDGRANNNFNGVNPFGDRDPNAVIFKNVLGSSTPQPTHISIPFSSLASQAVGPPGSPFEMSCDGRIFPNMGRKMLTTVPLGQQTVDTTDGVLGTLSSQKLKPGAKGLSTTYISMVQKAFKPEYWKSTSLITIGSSSPVSLSQITSDLVKIIAPGKVVPATADVQRTSQVMIPTNQYTQIEANFSLFWGLSIQLYEDSLIANDSPVDQFFDGKKDALTPEQLDGMAVFENQGRCINCHGGPETTNASISKVTSARLEHMRMGDSGVAVYDDGFYNIGVRPTTDDKGIGGTDPFVNPATGQGNPLSEAGYCQQQLKATGTCYDLAVLNMIGRGSENIAPAPLSVNDRLAVNGNFKAPGLRNVELTGPYFHNGGQATLRQVVDFYSRGGDFADANAHDLDPDISPIGLSEVEKNDLVAFLIGLTDERVRWERAPFDHPSLCLPSGHAGSMTSVTPDPLNLKQATDTSSCLPAVGAAGRTTAQGPVLPFLAKPGDPNLTQFQYQPAPIFTGDVKAGAAPEQNDAKGTTAALFAPPLALGAAPAATLFSWGNTSPSGMTVVNGQLWVSDHVMGLCRLDAAPNTLHAVNGDTCDPNGTVGSPGQPAFDNINNFIYVPDNSAKSAGVWRLTYHADTGLIDNPVPLDASLAGLRVDAVALGPDMFGQPNGALYLGSLRDPGIRRVNNILDPNPQNHWIDVIAQTADGRGINGSMAFLGNDLYLPENRGMTVIRNAPACFALGCFTEQVPIPGMTFANSIATDGVDKVYVATNVVPPAAAGAGGRAAATVTQAEIFRYSVGSGTAVLFQTQGMNPTGPAATEDCTSTCTRPADPWTHPGQPTALFFVLGMYYDQPTGTLYIADDPQAGSRFGAGHVWTVNAAQVP